MSIDAAAPPAVSPTTALRWPRWIDRFESELLELPPCPTGSQSIVTEDEVAGLPGPVLRYLRFMGAIGRPRRRAFRAAWSGVFRLGPDARFEPCEAVQFDRSDDLTRIFHMQTHVARCVPTRVRDTYVGGRARMLAKLFDRIPIVDVTGPELDISELVTFLNDAVMMAPSMLLDAPVSFRAIEDDVFEVSLTDRDRTVRAQVTLRSDGAPIDFTTWDRFANDPFEKGKPFVRARWSTPIDGFAEHDGHRIMGSGRAKWQFEGGSFEYVRMKLQAGTFAFDPAPALRPRPV